MKYGQTLSCTCTEELTFEPLQKKTFEELFPKGINYIESFNASEGYFGIQDNPNKNDLLLMLRFRNLL